jgi:hypothetical protein
MLAESTEGMPWLSLALLAIFSFLYLVVVTRRKQPPTGR